VVLPDAIVVSETSDQGGYDDRQRGESARLNLRAPQVLSLSEPIGSELGDIGGGGPAESQAAKPAASTLHGLPQRVRPDSQSANDGVGPAENSGGIPRPAPVEAPTPDDARSLAASLQSSWQRSRGDQVPAPPLASRARRPADGDRDDADNEEA
jgi:hypothetical protein